MPTVEAQVQVIERSTLDVLKTHHVTIPVDCFADGSWAEIAFSQTNYDFKTLKRCVMGKTDFYPLDYRVLHFYRIVIPSSAP